MSSASPLRNSFGPEPPWRALENQLEELTELAAIASHAEFYPAFLQRLRDAVSAIAAVLWVPDTNHATGRTWQLEKLSGRSQEELFPQSDALQSHCQRIQVRLEAGPTPATQVALLEGPNLDSALAAIVRDGRLVAALEVFWTSSPAQSLRRNGLTVLSAFAEVANEFERHESLRQIKRQLKRESELDQFSLDLQAAGNPKAIWYIASNELARLIDCDRVTLLSHDRSWRVRSISRIDSPDRRSPMVRSIERLAALLGHDLQPQFLLASDATAGTDHELPWQRYLEETAARSIAFLPLREVGDPQERSSQILGGLLIERFSEKPFPESERAILNRMALHASAALTRVAQGRAASIARRIRNRWTLLAGLLLAAAIVGGMTPVKFRIEAEGRLQPQVRQEIFAPSDGIVTELHVRDGQEVDEGAPLVRLKNDEIQLEMTKLGGDLHTTRQQLLTVQAARLDASPTAPQREQRGQLAAEEERLKQVIKNLEAQQELLNERANKLTVHSPIAGRIMTTNVEQLLRSRPLRRGQRLMTVADEEKPWSLELWVRDADVGELLAARSAEQKPLSLEFVLATDSSRPHVAEIESIAKWTEFDHDGRPGVRVIAKPMNEQDLPLRAGATVRAKIDCGERRLAYVWFRDVIHFVQTKILF